MDQHTKKNLSTPRVEDVRTIDGRVYVTYSYKESRPLDSMKVTLRKSPEMSWDEFKEAIMDVLESVERNEHYLEGFDEIDLVALESNIPLSMGKCPGCGDKLDKNGQCDRCDSEQIVMCCGECGTELDEKGWCSHCDYVYEDEIDRDEDEQ